MSSLLRSYFQITNPITNNRTQAELAINNGLTGLVSVPSADASANGGFFYIGWFTEFANIAAQAITIITTSGDYNFELFRNSDYVVGSNPLEINEYNQTRNNIFTSQFDYLPEGTLPADEGESVFGPLRDSTGDNASGKTIGNIIEATLFLPKNTKHLLKIQHNTGQTRNFNVQIVFSEVLDLNTLIPSPLIVG